MTTKIKRKISETLHYKLIRITYRDSGYNVACTYYHYIIVDKTTKQNVYMAGDLKLAKKELQNMEDKKQNDNN